MMGAGHYSDRLMWMRRNEEQDGTAGAVGERYEDVRVVWCAMEQPSGAEKIKWSALQSTVDYRVRIRGCPGIKSVDRFRDPDDDTVYMINGVHVEDDDEVCMVMELTDVVASDV